MDRQPDRCQARRWPCISSSARVRRTPGACASVAPMRATNLLLTAALSAFTAACAPESTAPPAPPAASSGDAEARWFAHVEALANDDMRGRETGSPEHRKAADYVADHFKRGRARAGRHRGSCSRSRSGRAASTRRSRAWRWCRAARPRRWRSATRPPSACASTRRRSVEAPLVFAGHGLQIPEVSHDDFAGLDVKGKVVVHIVGQRRPACPGRWRALPVTPRERGDAEAKLGAIGIITIATRRAWTSRGSARRPTGSTRRWRSPTRRSTTPPGSRCRSPSTRRGRAALRGLGPHVRRVLEIADEGKALPHFPLPHSVRAKVAVENTSVESQNVVGIVRGQRPGAGGRVRGAHRAPRSRRRRRADQRRRASTTAPWTTPRASPR